MKITAIVKNNKNRLFNIAIIILALIIASRISKQQAKDMQALKDKNNIEIKKNEVLKDISKIEKKVVGYKNLLLGKDSNLTINDISNIARDSGVSIMSMRPEAQQKYTDYIKGSFNLTISTSDYHTLGNFISRLESDKDVFMVDYLNIRPESQSEGLTVDLKVSTIIFMDY